ncbi:MAG: hypothetical protein ACE5FI_17330, partial [Anaerolineales bacterium]
MLGAIRNPHHDMRALTKQAAIVGGLMFLGVILRIVGMRTIIPHVSDPQIVREALQVGMIVSGQDMGAAL